MVNYVNAMNHGLERFSDLPVSVRLNECLDILDILPPLLYFTLDCGNTLIGYFLLFGHRGIDVGIHRVRLTRIFPARGNP